MKRNFKTTAWLLWALLTPFVSISLPAQKVGTIFTNAGNMTLLGTSTMHDWTMEGLFRVEGEFHLKDGTQELQRVSHLSFLLSVENLKSEKKKLNDTAYKALKTDQYKDIVFELTSATIREAKGNTYVIAAMGNLTIAGCTRVITMNVNWTMNADHTITCSGVQKLKMTDYKIQPPGFLGLMKAHDEITLDFNFQFKA